MLSNPTALERAFELARTGEYASVTEIRAQLQTERHHDAPAQASGPSLLKQLRALCEASAARKAA